MTKKIKNREQQKIRKTEKRKKIKAGNIKKNIEDMKKMLTYSRTNQGK